MAAAETTAAVVEPAVTVEPVDAAAAEAAREKAEVAKRMIGFENRMKKEFDNQLKGIREASDKEMKRVVDSHVEIVRALSNREGSSSKSKYHDKLSEKSYKRIEKFAGGETSWKDWKYDFEILTGALDRSLVRTQGINKEA